MARDYRSSKKYYYTAYFVCKLLSVLGSLEHVIINNTVSMGNGGIIMLGFCDTSCSPGVTRYMYGID